VSLARHISANNLSTSRGTSSYPAACFKPQFSDGFIHCTLQNIGALLVCLYFLLGFGFQVCSPIISIVELCNIILPNFEGVGRRKCVDYILILQRYIKWHTFSSQSFQHPPKPSHPPKICR
jgi:hypothetical protein